MMPQYDQVSYWRQQAAKKNNLAEGYKHYFLQAGVRMRRELEEWKAFAGDLIETINRINDEKDAWIETVNKLTEEKDMVDIKTQDGTIVRKNITKAEDRGAEFSPDLKYRYWLQISWARNLPQCMFIGLNPSTADEMQNDPTVTRCIGFAKAWGCGTLHMANIFAFRATEPEIMKAEADPIGPENMKRLILIAALSKIHVAAWGTHGKHMNQGRAVAELLGRYKLQCFKHNADGSPVHPLYQPQGQPLEPLKIETQKRETFPPDDLAPGRL